MAIAKEKVLAALKTKLQGKSISKTYQEKWAERHASKIETEADLDDYLNDRLDDILDAGAEADRRVASAAKKAKTDNPEKKDNPPAEVDVEDEDLKDAPAYIKAILKGQKALTERLDKIETTGVKQSLSERFLKDERLKGIKPVLLKGRHPQTEEEFEEAVETALEELKDFIQDEEQGQGGQQQQQQSPAKKFGNDKPNFSAKKADPNKPATKEEVAAVVESIM